MFGLFSRKKQQVQNWHSPDVFLKELAKQDIPHQVISNVSLYDVDFEVLNQPETSRIVVAGDRSRDYLLRCLLAGFPEDKLRCVDTIDQIPAQLELKEGTSVYILHDSYQVALKDELVRQIKERIRARKR